MHRITAFFDAVDLIASRMHGLETLIIQIIILALALYGGYALFRHHPH